MAKGHGPVEGDPPGVEYFVLFIGRFKWMPYEHFILALAIWTFVLYLCEQGCVVEFICEIKRYLRVCAESVGQKIARSTMALFIIDFGIFMCHNIRNA